VAAGGGRVAQGAKRGRRVELFVGTRGRLGF